MNLNRLNAVYRPTGPREIFLENLLCNPGSFSTTIASDDWRYDASIGSVPSRPTHATDTTAYATQPAEESWYARYYGTLSPAKVSAGATGKTVGGQLT